MFEIVTKETYNIKVPNWTEEEWNYTILSSLLNSEEDREDWEEIFNIKF